MYIRHKCLEDYVYEPCTSLRSNVGFVRFAWNLRCRQAARGFPDKAYSLIARLSLCNIESSSVLIIYLTCVMDDSSYRLNFNLGKNEIYYHS